MQDLRPSEQAHYLTDSLSQTLASSPCLAFSSFSLTPGHHQLFLKIWVCEIVVGRSTWMSFFSSLGSFTWSSRAARTKRHEVSYCH